MARPRIGDIIEIETGKGFAYAQYTHQDKTYGSLIRVFDKIYPFQPTTIAEVAKLPVRFSTFFPLGAAVKRKIFPIVGHAPVREDLNQFPVFRCSSIVFPDGSVPGWGLWDGDREWWIGDLSPEEAQLPILEIWNDTLLIERIESGWRPEMEWDQPKARFVRISEHDKQGWILYHDPQNDRYWKYYYPHPNRQDARPTNFQFLSKEDAEKEFNIKLE